MVTATLLLLRPLCRNIKPEAFINQYCAYARIIWPAAKLKH